jgi:hypothetical protein
MSFFRALAFPFQRENQVLLLFVSILTLIWVGAISTAAQILRFRHAYMMSLPVVYGFNIVSFGYISYALSSRMRGQSSLPFPQLVQNFKRGLLIGLAFVLYNFPAMLLFSLWWSAVQAEPSFRPDSPVQPTSSMLLFICSFGLFAVLIAFLASASFLTGVLRYSASGKLRQLFDIGVNFSQVSWKLLPDFNLLTGLFMLWIGNRFLVIAFTILFNQSIAMLVQVLGYDSPFAPLAFVAYYTAVSLISFCAYLSYLWLLGDYAERLGIVALDKP